MRFRFSLFMGSLLMMLFISGCSTTKEPKPLYQWGGYQARLYQYFTKEDYNSDEQIALLEKTIASAESDQLAIAPGAHAHLGLLYTEAGRVEEGKAQFEKEKTLFPESTQFMNFLINAQGRSKE